MNISGNNIFGINWYFKKYSGFALLILFLALFFIYNFDEILFMRPQSVHQWRQCDCLSFTSNYYNHDIGFFEPQLHYLGEGGTGKTVSDFPAIYYLVAQLWKVFGPNEYIYRLLVLVISFSGLLALMKTVEGILKDSFMAIFIGVLLYSSTIFVYYSNSFLMNVPSFSFALIALYFFYRYFETKKKLYFLFSMICFLFGGLLKTPALMSFVALLGMFFIEVFTKFKLVKKGKVFHHPWYNFSLFVGVIILIFTWYFYAYSYNLEHNSGIFLIGVLPVWELTADRIKHIFEFARILWFESYHSGLTQYLAVFLWFFLLFFHKKQSRFLLVFTGLLTIGFVGFLLLFFDVFDHHDYYLINQLILLVTVFVSFFYYLRNNYKKVYNSKWLKLLLFLFLAYNVNHCSTNLHVRYFGWPNDGHKANTMSLETITPYLDQIGLSIDEKVLFMNDGSFNIALYLMNRRGYTATGNTSNDEIIKMLEQVDYYMTNDTSLLKRKFISDRLHEKVGVYKGVKIYKVY